MASNRISTVAIAAAIALGLAHAAVAATSIAALVGDGETAGQIDTRTDQGPQSENTSSSTGAGRPSGADIGITAMMQMLRDEGIDIDARMRRARADCRDQVMSKAGESSAQEIEQSVDECAVVEEGIIYARAINEMNANRVNTFNNEVAEYNARLAEADRKQREYELQMQGHNAEVAEIQRQQQQYERDMAAHQQLLAEREQPAYDQPSRQTVLAQNTPTSRDAPTAQPGLPIAAEEVSTPPPSRAQQSSNGALASNTPSDPPSRPRKAQAAGNAPSLTRDAGSPPTQGRMLSQGPQESVELAIMEASGPRIALVIGNEGYTGAMGALSNPVNDAVLIGATLRSLGFDVEILTDASQREMKEAVQRLGDRLAAAGDNATGLFYYAGHGVQAQGINYLIPVGSAIDSESDLELEAVQTDAVLAQMEEAYVSTRIVILDACRNMPLRRRTRSGTRGLARMETPNGSFVAYSTSPGSTAADGGGIHSPFAEALAKQMIVPDRPIEVTFREVRREVVELTSGDQVPWDSSSLLETFSFAKAR